MKMTRKKAAGLVLAMGLMVSGTVFGTMAYLTDETGPVTNTFTVGQVEITLDEAKVNLYGQKVKADGTVLQEGDTEVRVGENTYKLIPGHSYVKDPIVHVADVSEASYLFVEVENGISGLEVAGDTSIATQMSGNGWTQIEEGSNVWYYRDTVSGTSADKDIEVFGSFKLKNDATFDGVVATGGKGTPTAITIKAYAVQKDGFDSASAAWAATFGATTTNTTEGDNGAEGGNSQP